MTGIRQRRGFTLAEVLIVVAIISVLAGVIAVAVVNYMRSLGQLERDTIAKEIFIAAQNHLSAAKGEGYLGISNYGQPGDAEGDPEDDIYYFVVNSSSDFAEEEPVTLLDLMLPFGSIDETVRAGSYLIRYQKSTGLVLDVFYCTKNGTPNSYNHNISGTEYGDLLELRDTETGNRKSDRQNIDGWILGWYGGAEASTLDTSTVYAPKINIKNAEILQVTVNNDSRNGSNVTVSLLITGVCSKVKHYANISFSGSGNVVVLDEIVSDGTHFYKKRFDDMLSSETNNGFIPGENLIIQAVAFNNAGLSNIAYSEKKTTNSLFADGSTETKANIGNIRHLENLDKKISKLDANDTDNRLNISSAYQVEDLDWNTDDENYWTAANIQNQADTISTTDAGYFMPISPDYPLDYDGNRFKIKNIKVKDEADAGLFGSTSTVKGISNLELIDFMITGTSSAGSLAGTLTAPTEGGLTVTNVLVRNSTNSSATNITAPKAGGLIGSLNNGTVQYSAAAMIVSGSTTAGGLVGTASGNIISCYSGGHTASGSYWTWVDDHDYDVSGGIVGGLVGSFSGTEIKNSYSTCSVSGTTAGGLAGSASGSISNCYATGLVIKDNTTGSAGYAFLGSGSPNLSGNYYYQVINEVPSTKEGAKEGDTEPMPPVSGYVLTENLNAIKPLDLNSGIYNSFVGAYGTWAAAAVYDSKLGEYYSEKYPLRTVLQLPATGEKAASTTGTYFVSKHYGDWPSPEVFFVNK